MKAHPLFNEDSDNRDRMDRDIGYINIVKFNGTRRQTFPNQWEPESLMTIEDVFNAVGPGRFELIGRDSVRKYIVDRVMIEITDSEGKLPNNEPQSNSSQPQQQPAPAVTHQSPVNYPPIPTAQGQGVQIPAGTDPTTALMLIFMQTQMEAQKQAREDSRFAAQLQMQSMQLNMQTMAQMVTALGGRQSAGGADNSAESLMKGVELMSNLYAGINEGGGMSPKSPVDWGTVTTNIAQSIRGLADLAKVSTGGPNMPIIPPGDGT